MGNIQIRGACQKPGSSSKEVPSCRFRDIFAASTLSSQSCRVSLDASSLPPILSQGKPGRRQCSACLQVRSMKRHHVIKIPGCNITANLMARSTLAIEKIKIKNFNKALTSEDHLEE